MTAFLQSVTPTKFTDYEEVSIISMNSAAICTAVVIA
jgi:hypothetical protein